MLTTACCLVVWLVLELRLDSVSGSLVFLHTLAYLYYFRLSLSPFPIRVGGTPHADILRRQWQYLSTRLDAKATAAHMYQRNALTVKDLQEISALSEIPAKAAEMLLRTITNLSDAIYLCFLDVLKDTDQRHLYERLVESGYSGKPTHRWKLVIFKINQSINQSLFFFVRPNVDRTAGQLSRPHVGITETERNRTKT